MFGWNERPTKAEAKHFIGGDEPAAVFSVGQYEVTVPGVTPENDIVVTYRVPHYRHGVHDPRQAFPNLEVRDGELRLPLEDIVSAILSRAEPAEIAVALWRDDAVREQFVYAMVTRWSEMNVGDADRRAFLHGVKEAVHSQSLDRLADKMASLEHETAKRFSFWRRLSEINDYLRNLNVRLAPREGEREGRLLQLETADDDVSKIGGPAWNEARDHWRAEVLRQFPLPVEPETPADAVADAVPFA